MFYGWRIVAVGFVTHLIAVGVMTAGGLAGTTLVARWLIGAHVSGTA